MHETSARRETQKRGNSLHTVIPGQPAGLSPESIFPIVAMDSGLIAFRAKWRCDFAARDAPE